MKTEKLEGQLNSISVGSMYNDGVNYLLKTIGHILIEILKELEDKRNGNIN